MAPRIGRTAARAAELFFMITVGLAAPAARAQSQDAPAAPPPPQSVEERLDRLERELEAQREKNAALEREVETLRRRDFERGEGGVEPEPGALEADIDSFLAKAEAADERLGTKSGLYGKPFLERERSTYLGGYVDLEYFDVEGQNRRFTQHRFVPFIYADVTEHVKFAAEIEFEYGGSDAEAGDGETKVEFATVDYVFDEAFAFRAGAILVPLGKFNLIHDSPVNDLTDRPLVDQTVIPTTLTEAGLGFFGSTYPFGEAKLDYEIYAVNGFRGLVDDEDSATGATSLFSESRGTRNGRASLRVDNNNSAAGVGRVAFSPTLGAEIGLSAHAGKYDDAGENWLVIYAVDAIFQPSRFVSDLAGLEFQGEFARAEIERDDLAKASGVPDDMWGAYGQMNWHFMFDFLRESLPGVFLEESTFTFVTRLDHTELGSERTERVTLGLNFRPIEDTVFKFDYQFNFEDWDRNEIRNDAFVFSVASYF